MPAASTGIHIGLCRESVGEVEVRMAVSLNRAQNGALGTGWLPRAAAASVLFVGLLAGVTYGGQPTMPGLPPSLSNLVLAADESENYLTEGEALAKAAATGRAVEVGARRYEYGDVFANPDGTLTENEYVLPVRGYQWDEYLKTVPVDSTLVIMTYEERQWVAPRTSNLDMGLSNGGTDPLIRAGRAGVVLSLTWPGILPAPSLSGDTARYVEVLPGVDLVVRVRPDGFSSLVVIKTPEAAANPSVAKLRFNLDPTMRLTVNAAADGTATAVDAGSGGTVFEAAAPMMWDSSNTVPVTPPAGGTDQGALGTVPPGTEVSTVPVGIQVENSALTLVPDSTMLTDSNTQWPVYVDTTWEATTSRGWNVVSSGRPTQAYWKFSGAEGVGMCSGSSATCRGVGVRRLFYELPTSVYGTIRRAEFRVTMTDAVSDSPSGVSLYQAEGAIGPGTTWNNQPRLNVLQQSRSPVATETTCTATNQNVAFEVTDAVRESALDVRQKTLFGLRVDDESDPAAWKRLCGNAVVSITYDREVYRSFSPKTTEWMSPGGDCVQGSTRPYITRPPVLYMYLHDPAELPSLSRQIYGEVVLNWEQPAGTPRSRTFQTGWAASGRFEVLLPSDIPRDTVVSFRVRSSNGTDWHEWSSGCEFEYDHIRPANPDVDSAEYLPLDASNSDPGCVLDSASRGGVGVPGTFTFDSPSDDVVSYRYGFNDYPSPKNAVSPQTLGGPVSVTWTPTTVGPNRVTVEAVDRAGLASGIVTCTFAVSEAS